MRQGKHGRALRLGSRHSRVIANSAVAIDRRIPLRVIIYSAVASLAGSVAAVQIATVGEVTSSVLVGSLAGLFAGTLMAMLIMVYDMNPQPSDELPPNPGISL
jgi:hypothetical protein